MDILKPCLTVSGAMQLGMSTESIVTDLYAKKLENFVLKKILMYLLFILLLISIGGCSVIDVLSNEPKYFVGKIVDQNGDPVPDVLIKYRTITEPWFGVQMTPIGGLQAMHEEYTDRKGRFSISSHAKWMTIMSIKKKGYIYWNQDYGAEDNARIVFWKRGEPAKHLLAYPSGAVSQPQATARFQLKIYPVEMEVSWKRTGTIENMGDWSATIKIVDGGIQLVEGVYPFIAPEEGYLSEIVLGENLNSGKITGKIQKYAYIKTKDGKFGRVEIDLQPFSYLDSNTKENVQSIEVYFWINPKGSRNLLRDTGHGN